MDSTWNVMMRLEGVANTCHNWTYSIMECQIQITNTNAWFQMIQYQVNGLIQIKLAAQPLCLISSFFFLLFELQLNNFHFAGSVISSCPCLFFSFSSVTYMKKGSKRVAGRRVRACLQLSDLANPSFSKVDQKAAEGSSGWKKIWSIWQPVQLADLLFWF